MMLSLSERIFNFLYNTMCIHTNSIRQMGFTSSIIKNAKNHDVVICHNDFMRDYFLRTIDNPYIKVICCEPKKRSFTSQLKKCLL